MDDDNVKSNAGVNDTGMNDINSDIISKSNTERAADAETKESSEEQDEQNADMPTNTEGAADVQREESREEQDEQNADMPTNNEGAADVQSEESREEQDELNADMTSNTDAQTKESGDTALIHPILRADVYSAKRTDQPQLNVTMTPDNTPERQSEIPDSDNFPSWCKTNKLSKKGIAILLDNGCEMVDDIVMLTIEDIDNLGLNIMDRRKLIKAHLDLKQQISSSDVPSQPDHMKTSYSEKPPMGQRTQPPDNEPEREREKLMLVDLQKTATHERHISYSFEYSAVVISKVNWFEKHGRSDVTGYQVHYQECGNSAWDMKKEAPEGDSIKFYDLKPGNSYNFRMRPIIHNSVGDFYDIERSFLIPLPKDTTTHFQTEQHLITPTNLNIIESTHNSLRFNWYASNKYDMKFYEVQYRENRGNWLTVNTENTHISCTLHNLKPFTTHDIMIRAVYDTKLFGPSSSVLQAKTNPSPMKKALRNSTLVPNQGDKIPQKYLIQCLDVYKDIKARTRIVKIYTGEKEFNDNVPEKNIMIVGATGTGKSTLINGMANYLFDVKFEDEFRFVLVDGSQENPGTSQAVSQTEYITQYRMSYIDDGKVPYKLNIIDTPGFGDTRGIKRDIELVAQIKQLFSHKTQSCHNILSLDAVCFVCAASQVRLTPTQVYIIDSILSIFGNDIKDSIVVLATFADGADPPMLAALKAANMPYKDFFCFNNSALFAQNTQGIKSLSRTFWDIGIDSFRNFFDKLNYMNPSSLVLTREVLNEREQLQVTVAGLLKGIKHGLAIYANLKEEEKILEHHRLNKQANAKFKYSVKESKVRTVELPKGIHVTNCLKCNLTCHERCGIADDSNKMNCWAMDQSQTPVSCRICKDKCPWNEHKNMRYYFILEEITVERTYDEIKEKYEKAFGETLSREKIVDIKKEEIETHKKELSDIINHVADILAHLDKIALKQNPLSRVDYIDLLIDSEERELKPGYKERVAALHDFKKQAEIVDQVKEGKRNIEDYIT